MHSIEAPNIRERRARSPVAGHAPDRAAGQRRTDGGARRDRGRGRRAGLDASTGWSSTRCTRSTIGRTSPGALRATGCSHVSYFLSHVTRPHFSAGHDRSGARALLRGVPADADAHRRPDRARRRIAARPPRLLLARRVRRLHGELHRSCPVLPRGHRCHAADVRAQPDPRSQVVGWCRSDRPLVEVAPKQPGDADRRIAEFVAERIPNGATIQTGIGAIPNAIMDALARPP